MRTAFQGVLTAQQAQSRRNQSNRKFAAFLRHLLIGDAGPNTGYSGAEVWYSGAVLWYSGAKIGYSGALA